MLTNTQVREPQIAAALSKRGKDFTPELNLIIEKESEKKIWVWELNKLQETVTQLSSKAHAKLASIESTEGQGTDIGEIKNEVAINKEKIEKLKLLIKESDLKIHELYCQIPNAPLDDVPFGRTPDDNVVVKQNNIAPKLDHQILPHYIIAEKYDFIDFEAGVKLTGSGFPVYKGRCAALQRKLINFFLEKNIAAGYMEIAPPHLVNAATAFGTGQLPDKDGQMYVTAEEGFYLVPTAEVPVTNIYRDKVIKESELPIKLTAYSQCFRREAGSYGKDVRGLNRVHEFSKVEIVQFVKPKDSIVALEEMVNHVESLLLALELPYRILKLCSGDMGSASAITYDFEVFSTGQQRWLEVSSTSNFQTFQSNRMNTRYKDESGKKHLVHTLNGSALALPRILATLLEYNYNGKPDFIERIFTLLK